MSVPPPVQPTTIVKSNKKFTNSSITPKELIEKQKGFRLTKPQDKVFQKSLSQNNLAKAANMYRLETGSKPASKKLKENPQLYELTKKQQQQQQRNFVLEDENYFSDDFELKRSRQRRNQLISTESSSSSSTESYSSTSTLTPSSITSTYSTEPIINN